MSVLFLLSTVVFAQTPQTDSTNLKDNRLADVSLNSAAGYFKASKPGNALASLMKAQAIYKKTGNKKGEIAVLKSFAEYYKENGLIADAGRSYEEILPLIEKPDTTSESAEIQLALAKINASLENYAVALQYNGDALTQFTFKGLKPRISECYVTLAFIKRKQQMYEKAERAVIDHALPLVQSTETRFYRMTCFEELGHIYQESKKYSQAKWFFIQENTQARAAKDTIALVRSLIGLGKVKTDIKDYDLAIRDFKEAQGLVNQKDLLPQEAELNKAFSSLYRKTGNKSEASRYENKYTALSDSIASIQKNKENNASLAKAEAEKLLTPAKPRLVPVIVTNNKGIYFLVGILVIILIGGLLLYFRRKK